VLTNIAVLMKVDLGGTNFFIGLVLFSKSDSQVNQEIVKKSKSRIWTYRRKMSTSQAVMPLELSCRADMISH
jgi:hypothetical protein